MMVLLRYLYALPYTAIEPEDVREACLQHHALVYVLAEKYQIRRLRDEAYQNIEVVVGPRHSSDHNFADFPAALRTILAATMSDDDLRILMMQVCIAMLPKLREREDFVSLMNDLPDLAVEIVKHTDLSGDWLCEGGEKCGGLPMCSNCSDQGELLTAPFEQSVSQEYRGLKEWPCPTCGKITVPICSDCHGDIEWLSRRPTREARYYRWI